MTAGTNGAMAVTEGKELEKRNWVGAEAMGVDAEAGTEGLSQRPGGMGRGVALRRHTAREYFLDKKPVSKAAVPGDSVRICQERTWG